MRLLLVDNAIRFSPAGGVVDVGLYLRDRTAVVEVSDTGPGLRMSVAFPPA